MTLPGYEAQRSIEMQWAFSNKKQSDYDTLVLDADLLSTHPVREVKPGEITKENRSDREAVGKGHEFTTDRWEVARSTSLSRVVDGSSYILGWLLAFAMGKVDTSQPDVTNCPNLYLHKFTFFDPDVEATAQMPVTTIVEKVSAATALKRYLHAMAVTSLTISGEGYEHISATAEFIGSGRTSDSALSMPALPTVEYLTSNEAVILLGDASENITTRVRSWSVTINNNPREARGYFPSSGLYRGRLEVGNRSIVPALVVDLQADSDLLDDFLSNQVMALTLTCEGALSQVAPCTDNHLIKFEFPRLYYSALPIDEADGVYTYSVTFDEESVLYAVGDTPAPLVQISVQNHVDAYLVASS